MLLWYWTLHFTGAMTWMQLLTQNWQGVGVQPTWMSLWWKVGMKRL
jgi:hypothetical protein